MNDGDCDGAKTGFATRAIYYGYDPAEHDGALTPPVYMTSAYAFESVEGAEALFRGEREGYVYGRTRNPTQALFERRCADLEEAEAALATASGMAAISSTLLSLLGAGDRVLIDHTLYGNSFALFMRGMPRFGVQVAAVDFTDLDAVEDAVREFEPKLIFCEFSEQSDVESSSTSERLPAWATAAVPFWLSTTRLRLPSCSVRLSSVPISSCIPRRNISAGMAMSSQASFVGRRTSSTRSGKRRCAT